MFIGFKDETLERTAAEVGARLQRQFPDLLSAIVTSPLSCRTPDVYDIWHPGYRRRYPYRVIAGSIMRAVRGFAVAMSSGSGLSVFGLTLPRRPSMGWCRQGNITRGSLMVTAVECGAFLEDGRFDCSYVRTRPDDAVLVFGQYEKLVGGDAFGSPAPIKEKVRQVRKLALGGCTAILAAPGTVLERVQLLALWQEWIFSANWLQFLQLEYLLTEIVRAARIRRLFCAHEMHAYARVVWLVAERCGIKTFAVQHATIGRGKRWYFTYPEERASGLAVPGTLAVYNTAVAEQLRPWFPETRFLLGCIPRYAHWKSFAHECPGFLNTVLFVGALARFDNDVLMAAVRRTALARAWIPARVVVRLHPYSQIRRRDRRWLRRAEERGWLTLSRGSLPDALRRAETVVGMSTTVLDEALLFNRQVIQLVDPRYQQFVDSPPEVRRSYAHELVGHLVRSSKVRTRRLGETRLGLQNSVVTYEDAVAVLAE